MDDLPLRLEQFALECLPREGVTEPHMAPIFARLKIRTRSEVAKSLATAVLAER